MFVDLPVPKIWLIFSHRVNSLTKVSNQVDNRKSLYFNCSMKAVKYETENDYVVELIQSYVYYVGILARLPSCGGGA